MDSMLLEEFQARHRACTRCVTAGYLTRAHPVFSGHAGQQILLVGQAPGPVEDDVTRPFAGRAGRVLIRWLIEAGFRDEAEVRGCIYMTSMTTCFPGRLPGGGDRRPSAREVGLCRHWLDGDLDYLHPRLILTVGTLSLGRFLPGSRLDDAVGRVFHQGVEVEDGGGDTSPLILPLPHPSGQSRWLNDARRRALLQVALGRLRDLRPQLVTGDTQGW